MRGGFLDRHVVERVVADRRAAPVDRRAVAAVAERDLVPVAQAGVGERAVVLRAAEQPGRVAVELRQEFEFSDAETRVQRLPVVAAVGRAKHPAVVARIDDARVGRVEAQRVLVGVDRVAAAARRDLGPADAARAALAAVQVDGAPVDEVGVVRRDGQAPVVPSLRELHPRRHRLGCERRGCCGAAPQQCVALRAACHPDDIGLRGAVRHFEPRVARRAAGQRHLAEAAAAVGRAHQPLGAGREHLLRIDAVDRDAPHRPVGQHRAQRRTAIAAQMQSGAARDEQAQWVAGVDREVVDTDTEQRRRRHQRPGLAAVRRAQQADAVGDVAVAVASAGIQHVRRRGRLGDRAHHERRLAVGQRRPARAGIAAAPQAATRRAQHEMARVAAVDDDARAAS